VRFIALAILSLGVFAFKCLRNSPSAYCDSAVHFDFSFHRTTKRTTKSAVVSSELPRQINGLELRTKLAKSRSFGEDCAGEKTKRP